MCFPVEKEKSIFHWVKKAFKILTYPFNLAVVKTIRRKGIKKGTKSILDPSTGYVPNSRPLFYDHLMVLLASRNLLSLVHDVNYGVTSRNCSVSTDQKRAFQDMLSNPVRAVCAPFELLYEPRWPPKLSKGRSSSEGIAFFAVHTCD